MESRIVNSEISILKFYQIFQIILIFLIMLCHIISVNKYFLIFKSLIIIFYISLFVYLLNFCFLVVSTLFIFSKKSSPTLLNLFKKIALLFVFFSFIKGVILTLIFWINFFNFPKFVENCPFNFSYNDINKLIKKSKKEEEYSNNCNLNRCIFHKYSDNNYLNNYRYICNFNAEYETSKNDIECHFVYLRDYQETKFYSYLEKCYEYNNYYECLTKEKKHDKYFVKYNQKCPRNIQKNRYIALGFLFPFIDIIADVTIWLFIYYQYKRIIKYINFQSFISIIRFSPSSLNSTKDSSIIRQDNNNRDIITQINVNQTEMIIYPPLKTNDKNKIKNLKMDKRGKDINVDINNNSSSFDSRCDFINNKITINTIESL